VAGCHFLRSWGPGCCRACRTTTLRASTYSILGTEHGYRLLWVLLLSTLALMVFHSLGARMGVVTGQGLIGLIRHRYGVGVSGAALLALVVANVGTATGEFAGIAAGAELLGISRYVAVPVSAVLVSWLVMADIVVVASQAGRRGVWSHPRTAPERGDPRRPPAGRLRHRRGP
jgi:hypothetical protein